MSAGKLRYRLHFQKRAVTDDGFGQQTYGGFETEFTCAADVIPRFGTEPVMASRLQGIQPVTIRIRSSVAARVVDASWRAVDARSGAVYAIVSPPMNADQKNAMLDMLATAGGQSADG